MSGQSSCSTSGVPSNDVIRTQVVRMYADFVSEVDPKGGVMDWLLQQEVVTFEQKDKIDAETTRQERCRKLLDVLFASSNPRAFVALRQSLVNEMKSWIVDRIDTASSMPPDAVMADTRTTEEAELLETELQAARKEIDVLRKEVQKLRKRDPTRVVGRKLVMVGSGGTGKSCLLNALKCGEFLAMNDPTVYETFTLQLDVDDIQVDLELWDTAGQHEYASIRQLSYPSTDVFVICFSVVDRRTLTDVHQKWYGEVRRFGAPIILLGNKIDLRRAIDNTEQVSTGEGQRMADEIKAVKYCECSAKSTDAVRGAFDMAVRLTLYDSDGHSTTKPRNTTVHSKTESRKGCSLQ